MDCICHDISFKEILSKVQPLGENITIEKLQELNICATKCKLCIPYIKELFP